MEGFKAWFSGNSVTILLNVMAIVWLASNVDTRLAHAEKQLEEYGSFTARMAVVETEIKNTNKLLEQVLVQLKR
jgi:hypothetical protein